MKQIILSVVITLTAIVTTAQMNTPRQPASYEAANWNTVFWNKSKQIAVAPPAVAQSKAEIQVIRQRMGKLDEKKREEIKYWDAGAPAYRWNQIVPKLISQKPETLFRIPASWMNIAIYDATILAWREKVKYKKKRPHDLDPSLKPIINAPLTFSYPCEHSVTAAAAANVLAYFFPGKADSILQLARAASQSRIDAGVQFPSDVEDGWKLGEQVARVVIEKAKKDDLVAAWNGSIPKGPQNWTGAYPVGITLASFSPIVMRSAEQFRPPAPPDFENDMKELKNFKKTFRSASLAYFWANNGPDLWAELVAQKMFEYRISDDAPAVALIYTVLNTAFHDAAIAIMDAKYAYWGIRPNQYDSTFKPLISTPPFPGYPSGHAAGAATSAAVLEYFFPADAKQFQQLAKDCADSRFYAGIHFRTDNETGLRMGAAIGKYVAETWMKKQTLSPANYPRQAANFGNQE